MAKLVKKSVAPIYTVAAVWLLWGTFLPLYRPLHYILAALASLAAFLVARQIWPNRTLIVPDPEPTQAQRQAQAEQEAKRREEEARRAEEEKARAAQAAQEARKAQKPQSTGDPQIDALIQERERALAEMRRLNDSIEDETISAQIDHMEDITQKIIAHIIEHPNKLPQIRKFLNYYLPTTLKLLNAYDRMDATGVSGANIDGTMGKIESMMDTIVKAFDRQLDALFADEAMDISADITVMENLLAQEGLTGPQLKTDAEAN